jgi:hypothetical protein
MPPRPDPRVARCALALAVASLSWACKAGDAPRDSAPAGADGGVADSAAAEAPAGSAVCTVTELARDPVVLPNGNNVYVHPGEATLFGAGYALVGPVTIEYVVEEGRGRIVGESRFLGVVVEPGVPVRTIPLMPGAGLLDWVQAVTLEDGRLSVLVSERAEDRSGFLASLRVLHGIYDGDQWAAVETVPIDDIEEVFVRGSSEVVRSGAEIAWTVPREARDELPPWPVHLYRWAGSGWTTTAFDHRPDALMLHAARDGLLIAVAGLEAASAFQRTALTIYSADSPDALHTFRAGDGARVRHPTAFEIAAGSSLAWLIQGPESWSAWGALPDGDGRWGRPIHLTDGADFLSAVSLGGRAGLVALDRPDPFTATREIRFVRIDNRGASLVHSMPKPFAQFFTLLSLSTAEALLIGAQPHLGVVTPFVRSLVIRLSLSC